MAYYQQNIECMGVDERRALQSERLCDTVRRVYNNVEYYRKRMDEAGVTPDDIRTLDDLKKLPFTEKTDLRDHYPYGSFAVPLDDVVRIHASSGTTGKQTVVGYTAKDVDIWADCAARAIVAAGGDRRSKLHVSYGYGLFTGGLGLHYGGEKLGCATIPASSGNTKRQLQILQDFGSDIICCTPSYALYLADAIDEQGIDPKTLALRAGIFGAEPWTEQMRQEIEKRLDIKAYDIYGLSEIMGPGVSYECSAQTGMHVNEDHFIAEIIDPQTGEVLPDGQMGEIVFTCITKEALPLIRYRTRDLCVVTRGECSCGRTFAKMQKPAGRSDDMLIIRGINVFPSQIESVLLEFSEVAPHYMIIVDRKNNLDTIEIQVEMSGDFFSDTVRHIEAKERELRKVLNDTLSIAATVRLVEPRSIERSEGKAKRVIDRRELG